MKAVTSVDNRGLTLPVEPDTGKTTESGYPIGNNVTCNLELRQAIAYAIDRQQVAMAALNGFGSPCYSENDGMPWNNPEVALETDVEYAKKLLADGGWADTDGDGIVEKDGIKAEFTCLYGSGDSVRQAVAMAAAEQLRGVGIQMNVEGTSWDDISKRMFSNAVLMAGAPPIPTKATACTTAAMRCGTTTTTPRATAPRSLTATWRPPWKLWTPRQLTKTGSWPSGTAPPVPP